MSYIYMKENLVPETTANILKHYSGFTDGEFQEEICHLEKTAIGVIASSVNLDKVKELENGRELLSGLCKSYVLAKLYEHIAHTDYIDLAADLMVDFRDTLKRVREAQISEGTNTDEKAKFWNLYIR